MVGGGGGGSTSATQKLAQPLDAQHGVAGVNSTAVKRASIAVVSSLVFELSNENIIKGNKKYVNILEEAKRKHKEEDMQQQRP